MSEMVGVGFLLAGFVILLIGLLSIVVTAGRQRSRVLAAGLFVTSPVGPLIYGLFNFHQVKKGLFCVLLGLILGAVPFAFSHGLELIFGLGEREKILNGERHLVLTGWDRPGYEILRSRTDTVVLELGNPNVSDKTLPLLLPMESLRELTISDSAVTDSGLKILQKLPALESLRMARTSISAEGLTKFLADPPTKLKEIDVSGNSIPTSILRRWKNQDSENRRYVN